MRKHGKHMPTQAARGEAANARAGRCPAPAVAGAARPMASRASVPRVPVPSSLKVSSALSERTSRAPRAAAEAGQAKTREWQGVKSPASEHNKTSGHATVATTSHPTKVVSQLPVKRPAAPVVIMVPSPKRPKKGAVGGEMHTTPPTKRKTVPAAPSPARKRAGMCINCV